MAASDEAMKLIGDWNAFQKAIDPKQFQARLQREVTRANARIGRDLVGRVRRSIRGKEFQANSPITILLKLGLSTPLVHRGDLFQQITFHQPDWRTVQVGVVKAKGATDEQVNVAVVVHEGATIDVSRYPQVPRKVWMMIGQAMAKSGLNRRQMASRAKAAGALAQKAPGGASKMQSVWVIPGRPYIAKHVLDPSFAVFAKSQWAEAVKRAIFGGPKPAGGGTGG